MPLGNSRSLISAAFTLHLNEEQRCLLPLLVPPLYYPETVRTGVPSLPPLDSATISLFRKFRPDPGEIIWHRYNVALLYGYSQMHAVFLRVPRAITLPGTRDVVGISPGARSFSSFCTKLPFNFFPRRQRETETERL